MRANHPWTCASSSSTSPARRRSTRPSSGSSRRPSGLDVVVHNAGHMVLGPTEAFTTEQLAQVDDTNVQSTQGGRDTTRLPETVDAWCVAPRTLTLPAR